MTALAILNHRQQFLFLVGRLAQSGGEQACHRAGPLVHTGQAGRLQRPGPLSR